MDISHVTWRKASYSGGNGGMVEVGVGARPATAAATAANASR